MSSKWITPYVKQIWVTSSTLLNKIGVGMLHGSMIYLLADIRAPDSKLKMNLQTSSWFAGCIGFSSLLGHTVVSIMMDRYGRRTAFLALTAPGAIGLIILSSTSSIPFMFLGRLLCGFCVSSTSILGAIVIGEYTCPEIRSLLLHLKNVSANVGSLTFLILGHFVHWRTLAVISVTPFVLSLFITYSWPESPFWLAEKQQFEKSEEAFYWLRGKSEDSTRELKELLRSQSDKQEKTFSEKFVGLLNKFKKKSFRKPAVIILVSDVLLEVSGKHIFSNYAIAIGEEITSGNFNSFYYTIVIKILIIISGTMSAKLIKTIGLRKVLFAAGTASIILLLLACSLLYLQSSEVISNRYSWLPLVLFVAYFFLSNLGSTSIPIAVVGELFPLEHRAFGSTLSGYLRSIFLLISLKICPYLLIKFMVYGTFAILGVCKAICLLILYFLIPETKNRTLQEIEDYFEYGKFREGNVTKNDEEDVEKENQTFSPLIRPTIGQGPPPREVRQ